MQPGALLVALFLFVGATFTVADFGDFETVLLPTEFANAPAGCADVDGRRFYIAQGPPLRLAILNYAGGYLNETIHYYEWKDTIATPGRCMVDPTGDYVYVPATKAIFKIRLSDVTVVATQLLSDTVYEMVYYEAESTTFLLADTAIMRFDLSKFGASDAVTHRKTIGGGKLQSQFNIEPTSRVLVNTVYDAAGEIGWVRSYRMGDLSERKSRRLVSSGGAIYVASVNTEAGVFYVSQYNGQIWTIDIDTFETTGTWAYNLGTVRSADTRTPTTGIARFVDSARIEPSRISLIDLATSSVLVEPKSYRFELEHRITQVGGHLFTVGFTEPQVFSISLDNLAEASYRALDYGTGAPDYYGMLLGSTIDRPGKIYTCGNAHLEEISIDTTPAAILRSIDSTLWDGACYAIVSDKQYLFAHGVNTAIRVALGDFTYTALDLSSHQGISWVARDNDTGLIYYFGYNDVIEVDPTTFTVLRVTTTPAEFIYWGGVGGGAVIVGDCPDADTDHAHVVRLSTSDLAVTHTKNFEDSYCFNTGSFVDADAGYVYMASTFSRGDLVKMKLSNLKIHSSTDLGTDGAPAVGVDFTRQQAWFGLSSDQPTIKATCLDYVVDVDQTTKADVREVLGSFYNAAYEPNYEKLYMLSSYSFLLVFDTSDQDICNSAADLLGTSLYGIISSYFW